MLLPHRFLDTPIAHRALHDRAAGVIENSATAIQRAVDAGYAIEIDVQLASDGVAMVFHDPELDRLTDAPGSVRLRSADELSSIRLSGSQDTIPTLGDVLEMVDGAVPLLIELKDQSGALTAGDDALERATVDALDGYDGPVAVMSFNPHVVDRLKDLAPDIPRGIVASGFPAEKWPNLTDARRAELRSIPDFGAVGASFVSHHAGDLTNPRIAALKADGVPILCWTIKSAAEEAEARRVADNITFEGYRA